MCNFVVSVLNTHEGHLGTYRGVGSWARLLLAMEFEDKMAPSLPLTAGRHA